MTEGGLTAPRERPPGWIGSCGTLALGSEAAAWCQPEEVAAPALPPGSTTTQTSAWLSRFSVDAKEGQMLPAPGKIAKLLGPDENATGSRLRGAHP